MQQKWPDFYVACPGKYFSIVPINVQNFPNGCLANAQLDKDRLLYICRGYYFWDTTVEQTSYSFDFVFPSKKWIEENGDASKWLTKIWFFEMFISSPPQTK